MAMVSRRIVVAGFVAAMLSWGLWQPAGAETTNPVFAVTYLEALPAYTIQVATRLKTMAVQNRRAPGNIGYVVLERKREKDQFAIVEAWTDQQALDAATGTVAGKNAFDLLMPYLKAPIDHRPHLSMSVDPAGLKAALTPSTSHVYVITHVDIVPTAKEEGLADLRRFGDHSRAAKGNIAFDLAQQANRLNHVSLIEVWRDSAARAAHDADTQTIAFRKTMLPISGAPFDERIYAAIQ